MSTVEHERISTPRSEAEQVEPPPPAAPGGDPSMLALPTFIVGAIALGLALTGYLPATAGAGALPIIILSTGLGMVIATVWAVRLDQSVLACVFGVFATFRLSYATLVLGLTHGWFAIPAEDATQTVSAFLLAWCLAVGVLTGVTLRLPLAFTVLFVLVDLALALVLLGNELTEPTLTKAGGYVVFAFAALGVYLFAGAASAATGGKPFPVGQPISS